MPVMLNKRFAKRSYTDAPSPVNQTKTRRSVVIGHVNGKISQFFAKLSAIEAKQKFATGIIAGNLFADPASATDDENKEVLELINDKIEVPFPTYFSLGNRSLPPAVVEKLEANNGELCENLAVLGRRESLKTPEGLNIVAVGGHFTREKNSITAPFEAKFTLEDAFEAGKAVVETDLLITSAWPKSVHLEASSIYPREVPEGLQCISELCTRREPRYHFSVSEAFYEREPFSHGGVAPYHITRFISLAPFGNTDGQKWIYAFSIDPSAPAVAVPPKNCTISPFQSRPKRKYNDLEYGPENGSSGNKNRGYYDWDSGIQYGGGRGRGRGRRNKRMRSQPQTPRACFFCLGNTEVESHMICAIGEHTYVATAKGPLTTRAMYPHLGFPGHLLLIPIEHQETIASIQDEQLKKKTFAELQRFRSALHDFVASKNKSVSSKLGVVTWEISRAGGIHLHWQFVCVPIAFIDRGMIEAAFDVEAENRNYPKFVKSKEDITAAEKGDFFKVMIWSETMQQEMVLPMNKEDYDFDLRYPRYVMATLMEVNDRSDWRNCRQDRAEELTDATVFKEMFKEFDFSRNEEKEDVAMSGE